MKLYEIFIDEQDGYIEIAAGGLEFRYRRWLGCDELDKCNFEGVADAFMGPAIRANPKTMGKTNVRGTNVCWVDIDRADMPFFVLPPTAIVWSGHGWHYYWSLKEFVTDIGTVEETNRLLASAVGGDSVHNADRLMRIPGSVNAKEEPHVQCRLDILRADRTYDISTLQSACNLPHKLIRKIRTGDMRGYPSRSERDWAIVEGLIQAGFTNNDIRTVFMEHECGDKYRDTGTDGDSYLAHTIKRLRSKVQESAGLSIVEGDDGYYAEMSRGRKRISTFVIEPTMLLEGEEDSIMGDIRAAGTDHVWKDVIIPKSALVSTHALSKALDKAAWVWLGHDSDVRELLAFLVNKLQNKNMPRTIATNVIGRHKIGEDDRTFFVTNACVLASDGSVWDDVKKAPIVYVETGRESPSIEPPQETVDKGLARQIANLLVRINEPQTIWPMVGWFMATPLKPYLDDVGYRFPVLNVFGTRGSGKSTTILRVFQPMLGYAEERSYDAKTTRFVTLSLLGSTNATPITFSEFRSAQATGFGRYILLAYDTGRDPRGRPDQTTVDYPLCAPFTLDGEDMVEDPAALERIVAVSMVPATIEEGADAWVAFQQLELLDLNLVSRPYLMHTLQIDADLVLDEAEDQIFSAFPATLPNRIRRNLTVVWFGVLVAREFFARYDIEFFPEEGAKVMAQSLNHVYSVDMGRAPTAADEFVETIVNAAARGTSSFPWELEDGVIWFQLTPAFEYYISTRARQHRDTLSRKAIKGQLMELIREYVKSPEVKSVKGRKILAYGVDIRRAHEDGLDVPSTFGGTRIYVDIPGR